MSILKMKYCTVCKHPFEQNMKFRIQIIKTPNNPDTFNPQLKTWWLGSWKSIIYLPGDFSDSPFELLQEGRHEYPIKEQAQGIIDAYRTYMQNKTFLNL